MTPHDPDSLATAAPPRGIRVAVVLLLFCGAVLCIRAGQGDRWTLPQVLPIAVAIAICFIPPIRAGVAAIAERVRRPSPRAALITALGVTIIAFAVLFIPSLAGDHAYYPRSHDEQMHMLQARMLAAGKLWRPAHELADFFDTFFVLGRPVYASVYFPGASLLFVPAVWSDLPHQLLPGLYSAIAVGLLYRVFTELIDGVAGVLGALLLLSSTMFRELAQGTISHNVTVTLVLAATWGWLRWQRRQNWTFAALAGLFAGWAAITRPVDALCYALPLALVAFPTWIRLPWRARLISISAAVLAATPFLALQLSFNLGVCGELLRTPYQLYLERDQPQTGYGFYQDDAGLWPASPLVQKHVYYDQFLRPSIQKHRPGNIATTFVRERLPLAMDVALPHPLLIGILPVGLLALNDRRRAAFAAVFPALALAYAPFAFLLSHYLVIWTPPLLLVLACSEQALSRSWPRRRSFFAAAVPLLFIAAAISAQPPLNPHATPRWPTPLMDDVHTKLTRLEHMPAVVLFRYDPHTTYQEEPVYNLQTPSIDDAPVIRAHDLGPQENQRIISYYAQRQPDRFFYLYDIASRSLQPLGTGRDLAARPSP